MVNEVLTQQFIEFIVDEIYPKFQPFCDLFENKNQMKSILNENIKKIIIIPNKEESSVKARYYLRENKIELYLTDDFDLNKIKKDDELLSVFVHESIHAILDRSTDCKHLITGCDSRQSNNKKVVKRAMRKSVKFSANSNVFKRMILMQQYLKMFDLNDIGEAFNEGLTSWITDKIIGKDDINSYPWEKMYVSILNNVIGTNNTVKLAKSNYDEMADILGIDKDTCIVLLKIMDTGSKFLTFIDDNLELDCGNEQELGKGIFAFMMCDVSFQGTFLNTIVIPKLADACKANIEIETLENLVKIQNKFSSIEEMHKQIICQYNMLYKEGKLDSECKEEAVRFNEKMEKINQINRRLQIYVKGIFCRFSKVACIADYSHESLDKIKKLFDKIYDDPLKDELINADFYKDLTEAEKNYKSSIVRKFNTNEGLSFKEVVGDIVKHREFTETEIQGNRAERRAAKRNKGKKISKGFCK